MSSSQEMAVLPLMPDRNVYVSKLNTKQLRVQINCLRTMSHSFYYV